MKPEKNVHEYKDVSFFQIVLTFILLMVAIGGYAAFNKYITANPADTEKTIVEKTGDDEIKDEDAVKLGTEKYYLAIATITNTKSDINKLYNVLETKDIVLEDENLINSLNGFNNKTYTVNSSVQIVSNYDEAISKNFTNEFINKYVLQPNGFIGRINNDYYIVNEKIDNYFFKEAEIKLMSKSENELYFQVVTTNYKTSCASSGSTVPSITCTDTKESDPTDFRLVKNDDNWKISEITLITA